MRPCESRLLAVFFFSSAEKGREGGGLFGEGGREGGRRKRKIAGGGGGVGAVKGAPSCLLFLLLFLSLSLSLSVSVSPCALFPRMSIFLRSGCSCFSQLMATVSFVCLFVCFWSCNQPATLQSLLCLCVVAYSDHLFISFLSIHPSIHQGFSPSRPHPNMAPHCLHKVQMKSLITHSPIGSCLRIIERVAAVALTFFLPPPPPLPRRDARLLERVGGRLRAHALHSGGDTFDGTIKEGW